MERTPANQDKSPPAKKKLPSKPSTLESDDLFEATAAGRCNVILLVTQNIVQVCAVVLEKNISAYKVIIYYQFFSYLYLSHHLISVINKQTAVSHCCQHWKQVTQSDMLTKSWCERCETGTECVESVR